jgi:WD40 repeat protein
MPVVDGSRNKRSVDVTGWLTHWQGKELYTVQGRYGVHDIAFGTSAKTLAWGEGDGSESAVVLCDAVTGTRLQTLGGHASGILSVAFSQSGNFLVSGSRDKTIKLWNVETGKEVRTFSGHAHYVNDVDFSPTERWIASASSDQTVKLWDVTTGREVQTFRGHVDIVNIVAFSPNGQRLVTYGGMSNPRVYSVRGGTRPLDMKGGASIYNLGFSPDGDRIVVATNGIEIFDSNTGKRIRFLQGHPENDGSNAGAAIRAAVFHPYRNLIATCAVDGTLMLWDLDQRHAELFKTFQLSPTGGAFNEVAFAPDGRHLVTANANGTVYVLRLKEWSAK